MWWPATRRFIGKRNVTIVMQYNTRRAHVRAQVPLLMVFSSEPRAQLMPTIEARIATK